MHSAFKGVFALTRLSIIVVVIAVLLAGPEKACAGETYYIDNQRVLLYKIINWWYDCLPEESSQLCGSRIRYENRDNAQIHFNPSRKQLTIWIDGGFADLLSVLKSGDGCVGPSHFECVWLNRKYFGNGRAKKIGPPFPDQEAFTFLGVETTQVNAIRAIQHDLSFVVEGVIGGLMNGKIALHRCGALLKPCPDLDSSKQADSPIIVTLLNSKTKELLAAFRSIHTR